MSNGEKNVHMAKVGESRNMEKYPNQIHTHTLFEPSEWNEKKKPYTNYDKRMEFVMIAEIWKFEQNPRMYVLSCVFVCAQTTNDSLFST